MSNGITLDSLVHNARTTNLRYLKFPTFYNPYLNHPIHLNKFTAQTMLIAKFLSSENVQSGKPTTIHLFLMFKQQTSDNILHLTND